MIPSIMRSPADCSLSVAPVMLAPSNLGWLPAAQPAQGSRLCTGQKECSKLFHVAPLAERHQSVLAGLGAPADAALHDKADQLDGTPEDGAHQAGLIVGT